MRYSISQVSKLAGVTSRTLRHYDSIGLLCPSQVGTNGYRWYGRAELRRLQRILLLRQMGVSLTDIGNVLTGQTNEVAALRSQRQQILFERDRLGAIVDTIERTITDLTGNHEMEPEDFFRGFHHDRSHLRRQLTTTYGREVDGAFIAAESATVGWEVTDYEQAAAKNRELLQRMADLVHSGVTPADVRAQELIDEHHNSIAQFWKPDAVSYSALADLYLGDYQQRSWINNVDAALPEWLAAAIKTYAKRRLSRNTPDPSAAADDET